ncbi:Crp/Fnr family transcriptional regulator [Chryseobacterium terrae]|uniref:Crp/Fnr family transcriptional regulator n=1 Tax=Chryseobacterium terrae TaxID=3163299 RepID=A0ABW8Y1G4_9FLAO
MIISDELLFQCGAFTKSYAENEIIFGEGSPAKYFYQIQKGTIKLCNIFDNGKEFIHGFPYDGHCFGESYLLNEKSYAVSAIAVKSSTVILLPKTSYLDLVMNKPEILIDVSRYTSERLHFRYLVSSFLAISDPMIRVKKILDHLKEYFGYTEELSFQVPFTRNQLASLTGLRVETIIRVIKKMESSGVLKIDHSKIYY